MKLIAVDVGNRVIKLGVCGSDSNIRRTRLLSLNEEIGTLKLPAVPCFWSVCSVNAAKCNQLEHWVEQNRRGDRFHVIQANDIPINDNVESRDKVGRDRLLAAWAAKRAIDFGREIVVVDAGTAVTIDKVDANGVFQGGVIFPGCRSCLSLLSNSTHDLPDLNNGDFSVTGVLREAIGKNTESAILRGVFQSQLAALKCIVHSISAEAAIIATGGEIELLHDHLPKSWQIEPLLLLQGAREVGKLVLESRGGNR